MGRNSLRLKSILCQTLPTRGIGHFTVLDGSEGEGDLVLIQTFFALLWKLFLKNTSKHKNNLIYIIKQEGLYQNKVTLSLASIHNCKMAYWTHTFLLFSYLEFRVCFTCYPPESFKIICLTCIWLKFVHTSFHSTQKPRQLHPTSDRHFSKFLKNRCVKLKTLRQLELGT